MKSKSKHTIERIKGGHMMVIGKDGNQHIGHIRIRRIYCGKNCAGCPHSGYKYFVYRDGSKTKELYLGKVKTKK